MSNSFAMSCTMNKLIFTSLLITLYACQPSRPNPPAACDQAPAYREKLALPSTVWGYNNYTQALACAQALDRPLFVLFSAFGCSGCLTFQEEVFALPEVQEALQDQFVLALLYVDDTTPIPAEDQIVFQHPKADRPLQTVNLGLLNSSLSSKLPYRTPPHIFILDTEENIIVHTSYTPDVKKDIPTLLQLALKKMGN